MHFRSFPPSSEFSVDFPEVSGNLRRITQRKSKRQQANVTMVGLELTSFGLLICYSTSMLLMLCVILQIEEMKIKLNIIKSNRIIKIKICVIFDVLV